MAITDIQISEELETNAPSIKYSGNEGPKSPQEMEQVMMAQLEEEYSKYVDDMLEQGLEPMSLEQFLDQAMAEGQMSGGNPLPSDPTKPVNPFQPKPTGPALPDRQMAAYGGIMGLDGRKQYGFGSSLKKFVRKVIPNEVSEIAVKAAPFVAPFNPLAAGLMSGIGSFDQTGRIGSSLKSGLMNYGLGNVARMAGGAGFQGGLKASGTGTGFGSYFTSPTTGNQLFGNAAKKIVPNTNITTNNLTGLYDEGQAGSNLTGNVLDEFKNVQTGGKGLDSLTTKLSPLKKLGNKIMEYVPTSFGDVNPFGENFDLKKAGGAFLLFKGVEKLSNMAPQETVSAIMDRGENLDLEGIRTEVIEAYRDPSGEKLKDLAIKYPYIHQNADVVNVAQGGRIGFDDGGSTSDTPLMDRVKELQNEGLDISSAIAQAIEELQARDKKAEGGIMDLGGKEKDYRNTGGFVDLGAKEKADDVPARLSVNEFVFTADAVRNAGGGDIDQGAEVMENMMKHLEQGGQVSEESQGMAGARDMFATSQRLSEVI